MDFLRLNNEFQMLQEKLDNYSKTEKKILEKLKRTEKQIIKLEDKKNKENSNMTQKILDLEIAYQKEIYNFLNELVLNSKES